MESLEVALPQEHTVLSNASIANFVKTCQSLRPDAAGGGSLSKICSLTLHIQPENAAKPPGSSGVNQEFLEGRNHITSNGSSETHQLWSNLESLALLLPLMSGLQSFSLTMRDSTGGDVGFWLQRKSLGEFLTRLPISCTALELDTRGRDQYIPAEPSDTHICTIIRSLLPRLLHLRLRLACLCPDLLMTAVPDGHEGVQPATLAHGPIYPRLLTMLLNIHSEKTARHTRLCNSYTEPAYGKERRAPPARNPLIEAMKSLLQGGSQMGFPAAQHIAIIDWQEGQNANEQSNSWIALTWGNPLAGESTAFPIRLVVPMKIDSWFMRLGMDETSSVSTPEEVFGRLEDLERTVEIRSGAGWVQYTNGVRQPRTFAGSGSEESRDSFVVEEVKLDDRESFRSRSRYSLPLWSREKQAGKCLLVPRVTQSLDITQPPLEDIE